MEQSKTEKFQEAVTGRTVGNGNLSMTLIEKQKRKCYTCEKEIFDFDF